MVAILEKSEHNIDFHPIVDFVDASPLRSNLKLQNEKGISSLPDMEHFENLTLMGYNISPNQNSLFKRGEGLGTPFEPHHTPSPEAQHTSYTTHSSPTLPPITTVPIPTVTQSDSPTIKKYTKRARIAQSSALLLVADEPASPLRDVSQGKACLTDFDFEADQDRVTIAKSSTLHHDSVPRVTSPTVAEGNEGEAATERVSDDIKEMTTVLTSMDATTVLASGVSEVPTSSRSIPTAGPPAAEVPTSSDVVPTAGPIFATAIVEYHQFATELPLERRIELISDLVRYQDNYAKVHKFQTQQRKPWSKKKKRDYYMAVIKSNLGWKVKDFRGMTFEEIEAKFTTVWKQLKDFIHMGLKEEVKRLKRKGLSLEQESAKKSKTSEEVPKEAKSLDEVPEEKVHTEGHKIYWKITRLGGSSVSYQFFIDMFKHLDIEDLNHLWALVKESLSNRQPTSDKEMDLWDYPLKKGLAIGMISYKLQVENYSKMENILILKIYKIASSPRHQGIPTTSYRVPTASEQSFHCQKKREANAKKIALLLMSRRNCQSKSDDSYAKRTHERNHEKANNQIEKFYQIFKDMRFEISFADALILMPKFALTLKDLNGNKEKLSAMARTPLNEHCFVVLLKKLPKKLGDPSKFLIPCDFPELADCSISCSVRVAEHVYVKVGELTLRVGKVIFNLDKTLRYSANYSDMAAKRIDVIDMACEEYSQEVLGFFDTISSGNPTSFYDPIVSATSPTLTPFENSDFLLEEVDAFLAVEDKPTLSNFQQPYLDPERDILLLESFLNDDPSSPPSNQRNYLPEVRKELKICEAKTNKSSVDEPPVFELKALPPITPRVFGSLTSLINSQSKQVEPAVSLTVESKIPTISSHVPTVFLDISLESSSGPRLITKGDFSQKETPSLGNAFNLSNRFEDAFGVEADLSNMETNIPVSPTPTFKIHKDHLKSQIISPVDTSVQTRHKSKEMEEQSFIAII
nr:reverse transcriptase domain-containing protein [Tanacetum cinerariifolium]